MHAGTPPNHMYTEYTYTDTMATRTISLAEDAYEALLGMKRPGESFSDVVRRLTRRGSLTELATVMDAEGAGAVSDAIEANRRERMQKRRRELDLE